MDSKIATFSLLNIALGLMVALALLALPACTANSNSGYHGNYAPAQNPVYGPGYAARRENSQERRIYQGERSGQITYGESARLDNQQERIDRAQYRAGADGYVSRGEAARIQQMQNKADQNINRARHNNNNSYPY